MKPFLPMLVAILPAFVIGSPALSDDGPIRIGPMISQAGNVPAEGGRARALRRGIALLPEETHLLPPLTSSERERLASPADEDGSRGRVAVGVVRAVAPINVHLLVDRAFSGEATASGGRLERLGDGRVVWTTAVVSPGAGGIRLMLQGNLPSDAVVFVYSSAGELHGPYSVRERNFADGFWTNTVFSDRVFVEVQLEAAGDVDLAFSIASVAHRLPAAGYGEVGANPVPAPESTSCEVDESCVSGSEWANVDQAAKAVAELDFFDHSVEFLCSGGLLNDTAGDATPYLLTAHHCFSTQASASTLEAFFQYHTASCNGPDPGVENAPRTNGATLLATSPVSDFTFVRLSENPPAGSVFLGWSRTDYSTRGGTSLYRLSHPEGMPQFYTRETVDGAPSAAGHSCPTLPLGSFIYSQDTVGATDGGSSGSPLMLEDLSVVGQLYGACGSNVNDPCAGQPQDPSYDAVDGNFNRTYASVAQWLAPAFCQGPIITTEPKSQAVMMGTTATLSVAPSGSTPFSYQWYAGPSGNASSPLTGATASSYRTPPLMSVKSFWVEVTNGCGSVASTTATVSVTPGCMMPSVISPPSSQTVATGGTATLSVVASGTEPFRFQWYQQEDGGGVAIAGATEGHFTTPPALAVQAYYVEVRNLCGFARSAAAVISPCDPPTLTAAPSDQSVTVGATAVLSVTSTGTPPFSYTWFDQDGETAEVVGSDPSLSVTATSTPQHFFVEVADACGSVSSPTVSVSGLPCEPPVVITSPVGQRVPGGEGALLTVEASGSGPLSYQWFEGDRGDTSNQAGTESTLPVTPSQAPQTFWVRVSNPCGSSDSAPATVTLREPPRRRAVHP